MKVLVKNSGVITLTVQKDAGRGNLFIAEAKRHIPFPIRRVYFINNIKKSSIIRGNHAHKRLAQVIFCAYGSFVLGLDDGTKKQELLLDDPMRGIVLGPKLWHTMSKFSKDCVILVLASHHYDERDYIRSYEDFRKIIT